MVIVSNAPLVAISLDIHVMHSGTPNRRIRTGTLHGRVVCGSWEGSICAVVVPIAQAYEPIFLEEGAEPSLPEKNIKILR